MARRILEEDLKAIIEVAAQSPEGASAQEIEVALGDVPLRTVQYRLKHLVTAGRLIQAGAGRAAKYKLPADGQGERVITGPAQIADQGELFVPVTKRGAEIQKYVRQPAAKRKPVGYNRDFLESYRPNVTAYLSPAERAHLQKVGDPALAQAQPAGTYAKQILSRLLIDLSWNSSRLEGNTYSLIDTKRLIAFGESAEGKDQIEILPQAVV